MKKIYLRLRFSATGNCKAQENVYPATKQTQPIVITNATVHVGNGQVGKHFDRNH